MYQFPSAGSLVSEEGEVSIAFSIIAIVKDRKNKPYFAIFFDISFSRLPNFRYNRLLVRCSQRRAKAMLQFSAQPQSRTTETRFVNEFSHCDSKFVCCGISAMVLVTKYNIK